MSLVQVIDKAAQNDPNWAWKMLQQRYPADYILPIRQELTAAGGGDLVIAVKVTDDGEQT